MDGKLDSKVENMGQLLYGYNQFEIAPGHRSPFVLAHVRSRQDIVIGALLSVDQFRSSLAVSGVIWEERFDLCHSFLSSCVFC